MIPQLISFSDFKAYKPLPVSFQSEDRLMSCINTAQEVDLRDLVGRGLYKEILDGRETAPYYDLINGTSYILNGTPIYYRGLIPFIAYSAYTYLLIEMQATLTLSGAKIKTASESETPSSEWLAMELQRVRTQAGIYANDAIDYINANISDFGAYAPRGARAQSSFHISSVKQPNFNISK